MSDTINILYVYHPGGIIQPLIDPDGSCYAATPIFPLYSEVKAADERSKKEKERRKKKEDDKKKKKEKKKQEEAASAARTAAMMARPMVYDYDKPLPEMQWWILGSDGSYAPQN
ncbi:hypothetical protein K440DRAFT_657458 [Wilcoxina mikolae CBS 423.85]|nr:hypothetical protein K440DRAFT_657458 [Wilcoxina mikolae CBS 423.85]